MYVTVRMRLAGDEKFLGEMALDYTRRLADQTERILQGKGAGKGRGKLMSEAWGRAGRIRQGRLSALEPIPVLCRLERGMYSLDAERGIVVVENRERERKAYRFSVNRYQKGLMKILRPAGLRIENVEGRWTGWLLGMVSEADYSDFRREMSAHPEKES